MIYFQNGTQLKQIASKHKYAHWIINANWLRMEWEWRGWAGRLGLDVMDGKAHTHTLYGTYTSGSTWIICTILSSQQQTPHGRLLLVNSNNRLDKGKSQLTQVITGTNVNLNWNAKWYKIGASHYFEQKTAAKWWIREEHTMRIENGWLVVTTFQFHVY